MSIKIRVDDFPQTRGEPQHSLAAYRSFHNVLSEVTGGKRYLLGVIPGRCNSDDLAFVRDELDVVVGMHGTDHDEFRLDKNGGNQFEPYLSSAEVRRNLQEHTVALDAALNRHVSIYMPPRNVIDLRTLSQLLIAGFVGYTGGPETDFTLRGYQPLLYFHSDPPFEYGRSDEMITRGAVEYLTASSRDIILTLHWTWETNIGFHNLREFLKQIPVDLFENFDD